MKNRTYAENMIYLKCKGSVRSVIRGKSSSGTIAKTIKTELDKKKQYKQHLTSEDIEQMLEEVYVESIEGFKGNPEIIQERNERFTEFKNELKNRDVK